MNRVKGKAILQRLNTIFGEIWLDEHNADGAPVINPFGEEVSNRTHGQVRYIQKQISVFKRYLLIQLYNLS